MIFLLLCHNLILLLHSIGVKMEYQVTVTEILSRVVKIDSSSAEEAEEKVRSLYKQEAIVLDWGDFADLNIKASSDKC